MRCVVEAKDSEVESIALEYIKGNESRRMVLTGGPPIERKMIFDSTPPDIFYIERLSKDPDYKHPYTQLFQPKYGKGIKDQHFDDASRRMPVFSEYRIPWFVDIPDAMKSDYLALLQNSFGSIENFQRYLFKRNSYLDRAYSTEQFHINTFINHLKQQN